MELVAAAIACAQELSAKARTSRVMTKARLRRRVRCGGGGAFDTALGAPHAAAHAAEAALGTAAGAPAALGAVASTVLGAAALDAPAAAA